MYKIEIRRRAQKALDRLQKPEFQLVIETVKSLAEIPRPRGVEKVKGTEFWRIRQGEYRIVYAVDDKESVVIIVRVGHRRDIYRML